MKSVRRFIGVWLAAVAVLGQEPPAVFRVTSALVQVDAVVTDKKGHHVPDLEASDFEIFEDGRIQPITYFSYVRVSPKKRSKPAPGLPTGPARREEVRRTIVLVVDDLGINWKNMVYVRGALRKFVETQMQPGDLVAVCRTGFGSGATQQFTTDKRVLLSVIEAVRWNPNARSGPNFMDSRLFQPAGEAQRNATFTEGTLGSLSYIVGALRELPGRKSIVLFSDGLELFDGEDLPRMHKGGEAVNRLSDFDIVQQAVRRLLDRANRAGTVIYTIHTAGLDPLQAGAGDRVDVSGMNDSDRLHKLVNVHAEKTKAFQKQQQGLGYIADQTGGIAYENGNDFNWAMDRVLEDQEDYYLIGYHPPEETFEGKHGAREFHKVVVKVSRAGLRV